MKRMPLVPASVLALLTLFACAPATTPTSATGNLIIRSYSLGLTTDPSTITAADRVNAILELTAPNGTKTTLVTDDLGFCDLGAVATGTYTVQPRYFGTAEAKSFVVVAGQTTKGEVVTPVLANAFYILNPARTPLGNMSLRKALVGAIARDPVVAVAKAAGAAATSAPATSTIPHAIQGTWSTSGHQQSEDRPQASGDLAQAKTELGVTGWSLTILYNQVPSNRWEYIATEVSGQWQDNLSGVTVGVAGQDWVSFLTTRDTDLDFQVARGGWVFESNNPLSFYRSLTSYFESDAQYTTRLNQAGADLKSKAMAAFDADLVALNDYLIDNALILPLYEY